MKYARCFLAFIALVMVSRAEEAWRKVDLADAPATLSTVTALLRNHENFAKWVDGKPLGEGTCISVAKDRISPSRTAYTLVEFDADKKPARFLRVDEIATLDSEPGTALEQTKLRFSYPAAVIKPNSFGHPSVQRAVQQMVELQAAESPVLYFVGNKYVSKVPDGANPTSKLERLSKDGIALVCFLSGAGAGITKALQGVDETGDVQWDPSSVKRIRFEISPNGREVRQVEVRGLFQPKSETLISPDASGAETTLVIAAPSAEPSVTLVRQKAEGASPAPAPGAPLNFDTKN